MVGKEVSEVRSQCDDARARRGVYSLEGKGQEEKVDEIEAIDEEEQAEVPACFPNVYQPTQSEYLDHCVTHYP